MAAEVLILRGISGSGKTYTAREHESLTPQTVVVSTLGEFLEHVRSPDTLLIVDARNLRALDVAPYYSVAEVLGCDVQIETHFIDPARAANHRPETPMDVLVRQYATLLAETNNFPSDWKHVLRTYGGSEDLRQASVDEEYDFEFIKKLRQFKSDMTKAEEAKEQQTAMSRAPLREDDDESFDDEEEEG
jgi:hypothetical protein